MCRTKNGNLIVGNTFFIQDDANSGSVVAYGHVEENVIGGVVVVVVVVVVVIDIVVVDVVVGTTLSCDCGHHGQY